MRYPTRSFIHLDETFSPSKPVDDDHPMVALRPDLFSDHPKKKTPKAKATAKPVDEPTPAPAPVVDEVVGDDEPSTPPAS